MGRAKNRYPVFDSTNAEHVGTDKYGQLEQLISNI